MVPPPKKLDIGNGVPFSDPVSCDRGAARAADEVLIGCLEDKARKYLENGKRKAAHRCFEFQIEAPDGSILQHTDSRLMVPEYTRRLFEGTYIDNVPSRVADYVFGTIIGYNDYFRCPCIVIRDFHLKVVDIGKYRPFRVGYEDLPKYLYEKSSNKPRNRGKNFLYLFQREMERLIKREGYVFVVEGLKNAVNGLVRSIPCISIESSSNVIGEKLVGYINALRKQGVHIYAAMDGDESGRKAFDRLNGLLAAPVANLLDFDSGLDLTNYLRKERL